MTLLPRTLTRVNSVGVNLLKRYFILSMYLYASLALSEWACGNTLLSHFDEPASVGIDEAALTDAVSIIRDSVDGNEIPGAVI